MAGDGQGLAAAILSLASDRILARDMGLRGRVFVEEHFSRERCTEQVENLLQNIIGGIQ
jgi:glycosyltransferase involved in cell wall biosynthesis